jgi:peptidoglycan/LPS O-acetylase OafA/YrhL
MTGFYAIAPYFICMAVILAIAASPIFRWADSSPSPGNDRVSSIDGLRGFLALAVFFHHGTIYRIWLLHHVWEVPPSRFYTQLGQSGVAFFFMITGYLFWSRLLRNNGRLNFPALYIGRLFRLGPLYLFAIAIMLCIVLWHTGLRLNVSPAALCHQLAIWAALGFFGNGPDVNGYAATSRIVASVMWSLHFEWLFYLSLLATCFLARLQRRHLFAVLLPLAFLLILIAMHHFVRFVPVALFLCGMACGSMEKNGLLFKAPDRLSSSCIILFLLLDFSSCDSAYSAAPIVLMGLIFYLIVSGSTLFGLLTHRASIRLGDISYGTYLLQGLVLYSIFSIGRLAHFALGSPISYWLVLLICSTILVFFAMATHVAIERPGVDQGKRAAKALPAYVFSAKE